MILSHTTEMIFRRLFFYRVFVRAPESYRTSRFYLIIFTLVWTLFKFVLIIFLLLNLKVIQPFKHSNITAF